jgi:hypothetical protein
MTRRIGWRWFWRLGDLRGGVPAWAADASAVAEGAATTPPRRRNAPTSMGCGDEYAVGRFGVEDATPWWGGAAQGHHRREKTTWLAEKRRLPQRLYLLRLPARRSIEQGDDYFTDAMRGGVKVSARIIDGRV